MLYNTCNVYCKDYSNQVFVKKWTDEDVKWYFRDGRRCSPFCEQELKNMFDNIWKPEKEKKGIDLIIDNCIIADVKCLTDSGCNVSKSIFQGGGRDTNATDDLFAIPDDF